MNATEVLRQTIDDHERRLRAGIPPERQAALLALVRAIDGAAPNCGEDDSIPRVISGPTGLQSAGNIALQFCLDSDGERRESTPETGAALDDWAHGFLTACRELSIARSVLMQCETGFMRLASDDDGSIDGWIASGRAPATWRERVDFEWWRTWRAGACGPELTRLRAQLAVTHARDERIALYRTIADVFCRLIDYQVKYPADAQIAGLPLRTYWRVLSWLLATVLRARDEGHDPLVVSEATLSATIATDLSLEEPWVARVIADFTFDRQNAAHHASVPGIAAAPLVRIGSNQVALSLHGLTTEPMLFAMRELRRRDPQAYHNAAWQREVAFRHDLYDLFQDKRFVASEVRIQLRREKGGLRTDVDAAVFDRKTGVLALFELKAQDPFTRSSAELMRQRDNVLQANRQVAGILDWLNRNGPDELLNRIDHPTAKRFRVRKVLPFVLGRYLVHFPDGPAPDRRAAWGTWPQILRLTGGQPFTGKDGNPLMTLFTGLRSEDSLRLPPRLETPQTIDLGDECLTIFPNFAAYKRGRPNTSSEGHN